jgi:hypothetical protein
VVIAVVVSVPILAVVVVESTILAFADTVKYEVNIAFAFELFTADILFADKLPVTVTAPNVVAPPLLVDVNPNHAAALDSPSVGHTYSVLLFVLYHSCPLRGLAGGAVSAKFSAIWVKLVSNACP